MANVDSAFGLEPVLPKGGTIQTTEYFVPASDGTALFIGDPVIIAGSGDTVGVPSITRATGATAARITGVVVGFKPDSLITAVGYRAASTAAYALVCDDPEQVFEVQDDSVGGNLAVTDIGLNANLIAAAGSTATKRSGFELDTSSKATTATHQVRILGFVQRPDVEIGANTKVLVRINTPTETGAAGSTGV
jgi:hypothetical protein